MEEPQHPGMDHEQYFDPCHPEQPANQKPEMSKTEATFHESIAGQRASAAAKKQGCDPAALDALAAATAGPVNIAGFDLKPATEGTFITLRKTAWMFVAHAERCGLPICNDPENPGERELYELGLATLVFTDARRVFRELNAGRLPQLMAEAMDIIFELSLEDQKRLKEHIEAQMEEIARLSGEAVEKPGKPLDLGAPGN